MNLSYILKSPVITEKTIKDAGTGVFTFAVASLASKHQIKQAIESTYSVEVVKVRTLKHKGKQYRLGRTRLVRQKPDQKIAKVVLKKGQTIELFDIAEKE